jgi:dTDP-4-dehydrorhamnose reductase
MKKILITGAKGQLGQSISFLSDNYNEFEFVFTDIEELDITDENAVEIFFKQNKFFGLVNCAAYTAVDKAESEPKKAFLINEKAVKILNTACVNSNCFFIHVSTDFVFDGQKSSPYLESDIPVPISVYGSSKLAGEKALEGNQKAMIIRTSWLYSAYGSNFVKTILRVSAEKNEISIVNDQIGSPCYAPDLATAILSILRKINKTEKSFSPGIYHYSNEGDISWFEFGEEIVKLSGNNCRVIPIASSAFNSVAKRPAYSVMSKNKIIKTYDSLIPDWKISLKKCIFELNENK